MMTNTAALVLVGTELIFGDTAEENRKLLGSELQRIGVRVIGVHIVRDEIDQVADLIRHLSSRVTTVITVGGLGPTVDDITLAAVARAFGLSLVTKQADDASTYALMSGSETTQPMLRCVPTASERIFTANGPLVRTHNVYSLPGLPRLVTARLGTLIQRLESSAINRHAMCWNLPQSQIAPSLDEATRKYPTVSIGCYPSGNTHGDTIVSFEGSDSEDVKGCVSFVRDSLLAISQGS